MDCTPLAVLAARQHGCITLAQAQVQVAGATEKTIEDLLRHGCLIREQLGCYRFAAAPQTWHQQIMIAVLSVPGGLASHRTAAVLWGLDGFRPGRIEVVTPHGRWRERDVIVHQSKDLVGGDMSERFGIPCTSLVRTLIDLPAVAHEYRCAQGLDHACRNDRTVLQAVRQRHLEVARRGRNGTVLMREMLDARGAGDVRGNGFEERTRTLLVGAGLPRPVSQLPVRDGDFRAFIDLAWPERMVGIECDSLAPSLRAARSSARPRPTATAHGPGLGHVRIHLSGRHPGSRTGRHGDESRPDLTVLDALSPRMRG